MESKPATGTITAAEPRSYPMSSDATPARAASLRRIPSLDGLRALSIVLVMGLHTVQRYGAEHPEHPPGLLWSVVFNGSLGVYIFFVISGYLITRLLLHERQTRGAISMSGFYLKRAFRILPPLYLYVGVIALLSAAGRLALTRWDIVSALFFFHNYAIGSTCWAIEHFWSLSVEEQFYLIWPVILILCLRLQGRRGIDRAAAIAVAAIVLSPLVRILSFRTHEALLHDSAGFHMHADALMFGCGAALLEGTARFERVYRAVTRVWWLPVVGLAIGSYLEMRFQNYWNFPFGETYTGLLLAFFLLWTVRNADSLLGRALNAPVITHIGVLSYSIYLWQTLFLHHLNGSVFTSAAWPSAAWLGRFPLNWIAIVAVAEISYRVVEQPSLRLRNRLLRSSHVYQAPTHPYDGTKPLRNDAVGSVE